MLAAGQQREHLRRLTSVGRLAEHAVVDEHDRIDAHDRLPRSGLDRARLAEAVELGELDRRHGPRLLGVGGLDDAELQAELREDGPALRRARRQDERAEPDSRGGSGIRMAHSPAGRSSPAAK